MKLKYNHGGEVREIPLTTDKPQGKRLAVRKNGQTWYAPLVSVTDSTASNFRLVFGGEVCALAEAPTLQPEIENILIAPPRVSVMQGQSATAIVSAEGNEAVAGLSFSIANNPTWITIADECILIQPSDNDQGEAIVKIIAKDTGSDASASAVFVAEALLRPIIESLAVVPPAVTVAQGSTSTAIVQAVANSAVGGLSYSLDGAPSWVSLDQDTIHIEPTTNDTGTSTVQVVAYDTNSSARADTEFVAEAQVPPEISSVGISTNDYCLYFNGVYYVNQNESTFVTLTSSYNSGVTGIEYLLENAPSWMAISSNQITCTPTANNTDTVTVTIIAKDTGSDAQTQQAFTFKPQPAPTANEIQHGLHAYSNAFVKNKLSIYALHRNGASYNYIYHKLKSITIPGASEVEISDPDQYQTSHMVYFKYSKGAATLNATAVIEEETGALFKYSWSMPISASGTTYASLSPAKATLATGTSGNQTVYIKATTAAQFVAHWRVYGYFPKNSTITPGVGFTSDSSLASLKVVYPKKDQIRYNSNSGVKFYATPATDAFWQPVTSDEFQWVSLSSGRMNYSYG